MNVQMSVTRVEQHDITVDRELNSSIFKFTSSSAARGNTWAYQRYEVRQFFIH